MISPIKVFISGIKDKTPPIQIKVVDRVFGQNSLFMKPIQIVVADIDVVLAKFDKTILFKFYSVCKENFLNIFGKIKVGIKFKFYLNDDNIQTKLFGKIKNTMFKFSAITNGSQNIYGKINHKIKFKATMHGAFSGYFAKFNNKIATKFYIKNDGYYVIFNYRFRKWITDDIKFQDTIESQGQQLTFGETCYKEI